MNEGEGRSSAIRKLIPELGLREYWYPALLARKYDAKAMDDDILQIMADKLAHEAENAANEQWLAEQYAHWQSLSSDQEVA